jgi:hypothetical protein
MIDDWNKYRFTYNGGEDFKEEYLKQFTLREDSNEFVKRKDMTYVPAFAKAAVIEIKNSIFSRMNDVKRLEGSTTYMAVINGEGPGVDRERSSMNAFMGGEVLPEVLAIGKVGIFVDQPVLAKRTGTRHDDVNRIPYLYIYQAEQIRSWSYNDNNELDSLLLQATVDVRDDGTGLVTDKETEYRHFRLLDEGGVKVTIYGEDSLEKDGGGTYAWTQIPFVVVDITTSLLTDVADYQIAHLNIASSDVSYAWKSNFPFYTEQRDPHAGGALRTTNEVGDSTDGTAAAAKAANTKEIKVGVVQGRTYPRGMDRPDFIHPSSEPLEVSMKKQEEMKREIRQLVQLAVTNMDPRRESAESKTMDERGLEAGLSYIAQELESAERAVSAIWSMYEQSDKVAQIKYPEDYNLKTTAARIEEGTALIELAKSSPSHTYQKEMSKLAAETTLGNKVTNDVLETIKGEIDKATVIYVDPDSLVADVETGLATTTTVSEIRGYPEGEAEKAKEEHAERAARIVAAQTAASNQNAAARGNPDLDPDPNNSPNEEKDISQSRDTDVDGVKGVRG